MTTFRDIPSDYNQSLHQTSLDVEITMSDPKQQNQVKTIDRLAQEVIQVANEPMLLQNSEKFQEMTTNLTLLNQLLDNPNFDYPSYILSIRKIIYPLLQDIKKTADPSQQPLLEKFLTLNQLQINKLEKTVIAQAERDFTAFQSMPNNKGLDDRSTQIHVLNQYEDGTTSGFENCGYHALKNALIMLTNGVASENLQALFNDKALFSEFYKTFCQPILTDASAKTGKKDASVTLLREIIMKIVVEEHPPKSCLPLQNSLRDALKQNSIAIFQFTTTTGGANGTPFIGCFDITGSLEAVKLAEFSKKSGPATLSCVLGNESLGHWYTITIHKDQQGSLHFLCADSLNSDHDILGILSPLGKMIKILIENIENPQKFLKQSFEPITEFISPRAGWFNPDGTIDPVSEKNLLDETPVPSLATRGCPHGSTLERNLLSCQQAFFFLESGGWIQSTDYWIQMQVNDLEIIVDFYAKSLPSSHPLCNRMNYILAKITSDKPKDIIKLKFQEAINDFEKIGDTLTSFKKEIIISTFTMMLLLYHKRRTFITESNELRRLSVMNTQKGVLGIEPGFVSGTQPKEVEKSFIEKMNILLLTYQEQKNRNSLKEMALVVASGDGCLTARMSRIIQMHAELQRLGNIEEISPAEEVKNAPSFSISETLLALSSSYRDNLKKEFLRKLSEALTNGRENTTSMLKDYAQGEIGKPFILFLIQEGIILNIDKSSEIPSPAQINWEDIFPKILAKIDKIVDFIQTDSTKFFAGRQKGFVANASPDLFGEQENLEILIKNFQIYMQAENSTSFKKYLLKQSLIASLEDINWRDVIPSLLN